MGYTPEEAGAMLRMAPATVAKIRDRAAELLRGTWIPGGADSRGERSGSWVAPPRWPAGASAFPPRHFWTFSTGGQTGGAAKRWSSTSSGCLHCVDHFCRMAEVIEVLRGAQPLSDEESAPFSRCWESKRRRGKGGGADRRLIQVSTETSFQGHNTVCTIRR